MIFFFLGGGGGTEGKNHFFMDIVRAGGWTCGCQSYSSEHLYNLERRMVQVLLTSFKAVFPVGTNRCISSA